MKTKLILSASFLMGAVICAPVAMAQAVTAQPVSAHTSDRVSDRKTDRVTDRAHVPAELHRKVVRLYFRIHNAYPDASRQRIFIKIAEELGIAPRRLWNLYHNPPRPNPGPVITDAQRVDKVDRASPSAAPTRQVTDRRRSVDRIPSDTVRTDRARVERIGPSRPEVRPVRPVRPERPVRRGR